MRSRKAWLCNALGVLMILAGIQHFRDPMMYEPFIPETWPKNAITYLSGAVEIGLGVGVFLSRFLPMATLGILILMIAFLSLHVVDVFREVPAIGSKLLAYSRLPIQFVLIGWAWLVYLHARTAAASSA